MRRSAIRTVSAPALAAVLLTLLVGACTEEETPEPTPSTSPPVTAPSEAPSVPDPVVPPSAAPSPSPVVPPSGAPSPSPSDSPIDTTAWATHHSTRYDLSIGYPADWEVTLSEREWTPAEAEDWLSTEAHDTFFAPSHEVLVSVWAMPAEPQASWGDVEVWVEEFCRTGACGLNPDRSLENAVGLCHGRWECRPGLMLSVPSDSVQAYFTDGDAPSRMVAVAVWRPDDHWSVDSYGGSIRLLEAFLSTMDVCPAQLVQAPGGCPAS